MINYTKQKIKKSKKWKRTSEKRNAWAERQYKNDVIYEISIGYKEQSLLFPVRTRLYRHIYCSGNGRQVLWE